MDYDVSQSVPSNAEVIDDLIKDLGKSYIQEEKIIKNENKLFDICAKSKETNEINHSNKNDETSEKINEQEDEYFIDESALKDRDLTISDEQKQELKCESNNHKSRGNNFFQDGNYISATFCYTEGLRVCPLVFKKERSILYANRAAAKAKFMVNKNSAITDCTKAIDLDSNYIKVYLRRAQLYKELDKLDEALADYKAVLTIDPMHKESVYAINILEPTIKERNEKLKEEMMGKLKDLGNMVLRPFGLSTNNFQMQKDESSGSYSVKFVQNPT